MRALLQKPTAMDSKNLVNKGVRDWNWIQNSTWRRELTNKNDHTVHIICQ